METSVHLNERKIELLVNFFSYIYPVRMPKEIRVIYTQKSLTQSEVNSSLPSMK